MKKAVILACLIISFITCSSVISAEIRINEIELNPSGEDSGNEWLELYSDSYVNLVDWQIRSTNGRNMSFNASFSGYYVIKTPYNLLTNNDQKISLYNQSTLIFSTEIIKDDDNSNLTWQYCEGSFKFEAETKGLVNNCGETSQIEQQEDLTTTHIELGWNKKDIINGEEFKIEVFGFNLKSYNYDVKVWIEDASHNILSERFDNQLSEWKSGVYFFNEFFTNKGNRSEYIRMRINRNNENFSGNAKIFAQLRKSEDAEIVDNFEADIYIINNKQNITELENITQPQETPEESKIVLKNEGAIVYKSKKEYIKEYAIYGFIILLILLILLALINLARKKRKN